MKLGWVTLALAALAPGVAHGAARTVTLVGVKGAGADRFAAALEGSLGELYELVSGDQYRRTATSMGETGGSPDQVAAVAEALHLDAILVGAVLGTGKSRRLLVVVRSGATGEVATRLTYELAGRTLAVVRDRVVSDLVRALEPLGATKRRPSPRPVAPALTESEPESAPEPMPEEGATRRRGKRPPREDASDEGDSLTVERQAPGADPSALRGVSAGVGLAILNRSLAFDVASAPGYGGGAILAVRVDGRVNPLALSNELAEAHPALASFGLAGFYEVAPSFMTTTTQGGLTPGRASRFAVLLVGRIPFGQGERKGGLTVESGVQELNWGHTSPADVQVPDVGYDLFDFGLRLDQPLGSRIIAVDARLAVLGLVAAGAIADDAQYGHATGWGLDGELGITARPTRWLWLRASGSYSRIALSFSGSGTRYARSASDQWLGGALQVGFAL